MVACPLFASLTTPFSSSSAASLSPVSLPQILCLAFFERHSYREERQRDPLFAGPLLQMAAVTGLGQQLHAGLPHGCRDLGLKHLGCSPLPFQMHQ